MRAYVKFIVILLTAVTIQTAILDGLPALADVHLAARSLYLERFGTDADRAAFDAQVDELVFRERVRVLKRARAARP